MKQRFTRAGALLLLCIVAGCAGMRQYPIAVPASSSGKFFAHIRAAAQNRGYMVSQHDPSDLGIRLRNGEWLQYHADYNQNSITLVVRAHTKGLSKAQVAERQDALRQLSDQLIAEARRTAADANVFE